MTMVAGQPTDSSGRSTGNGASTEAPPPRVRVLDLETVAERVGCSKGHVSKLINGKVKGMSVLPAVRIGRRVYVLEATLEAWLKGCETSWRSK
jgi:excisionase family DNA binding protein